MQSISDKSDLGPAAEKAIQESELADSRAQDTLEKITKIISRVPEEVKQAKQLPRDVGAIKQDVSQAKNQC